MPKHLLEALQSTCTFPESGVQGCMIRTMTMTMTMARMAVQGQLNKLYDAQALGALQRTCMLFPEAAM